MRQRNARRIVNMELGCRRSVSARETAGVAHGARRGGGERTKATRRTRCWHRPRQNTRRPAAAPANGRRV